MRTKKRIYINAPITLGFIGICLLALLLNVLTAGKSNELLFMAYRSSWLSPLTYCRLVTHVFGHVDWSHFFSNAMYLLLLGPSLEEKYKSKKTVFIIVLTAFCSGVINILLFPRLAICGASGIVFAFILLGSFTNTQENGIPITVLLVAVFFLGQQIYEGISSQDSISQLSHIVGGLIGAICGFCWRPKQSYGSYYKTQQNRKSATVKAIVVSLLIASAAIAILVVCNVNQKSNSPFAFNQFSIPQYEGEISVKVNGNTPFFKENDYTTESFEYYSPLDKLGRCGVAMACLGQETMPTEERGAIGMIKPSGWKTIRYDDLIEDKYLYNRCHLIAYMLSGENANEMNLITGTRYFNVTGMLPYENETADYINSTGNHVLYRVTPCFSGKDLVAKGVLMEAYSIEDNGQGLQFNVFVFNVQPGIEIDYATGESARMQ